MIAAVGEYPSRRASRSRSHQINVAALTKSDAGKGDILSDKDDILSSYGADNMTSATPKHDICDAENMTPMSYDPSLDPPIETVRGARARRLCRPHSPTAQPSADFGEQPNTTRSLVALPAVVAYRDVFLAYPSARRWCRSRLTASRICTAGRRSVRRGARPDTVRNIGGLLDWYDDPQRRVQRQPPALRQKIHTTNQGRRQHAGGHNVMAMIERGEM